MSAVTPEQLADIRLFSGLPSADLHAGDVFGEAGTLSLEHRNATVIATRPARLGVLMGWEVRDLAAGSPELAARLDELIASRAVQDRRGARAKPAVPQPGPDGTHARSHGSVARSGRHALTSPAARGT